ncbi:UNVERIFIED_ORG: 4Fe-4S dicluster domain protein [Clostridioides difficile F501]
MGLFEDGATSSFGTSGLKLMKGYLNTGNRSECYGCGACVQACAFNAMEMIEDEEGFRYPVLDGAACADCGCCHRVCPSEHEMEWNHGEPIVFGGYHRDPSVLSASTSGGAFSALVEAWFLRGGERAAWGAVSDGVDVRHEGVFRCEEASKFRKSKYSQSDTGNSFKEIRHQLASGVSVLFSGTPCQVAGLRFFLGDDHLLQGELLTVEVVCEGVPSPLYVRKYIERLEHRFDSRIVEFDYRFKDGRRWDFEVMSASFQNGANFKIDRWFNPFWSIWLQHLMNRPSCYTCPFACLDRMADITLGDLWGVHLYCPDLYNRNAGASLIACSTNAGFKLLADARPFMKVRELPREEALRYQGPMRRPIGDEPKREAFMSDLQYMEIGMLEEKWARMPSAKLLVSKYIWGNRQKVALWNLKKTLSAKSRQGR